MLILLICWDENLNKNSIEIANGIRVPRLEIVDNSSMNQPIDHMKFFNA